MRKQLFYWAVLVVALLGVGVTRLPAAKAGVVITDGRMSDSFGPENNKMPSGLENLPPDEQQIYLWASTLLFGQDTVRDRQAPAKNGSDSDTSNEVWVPSDDVEAAGGCHGAPPSFFAAALVGLAYGVRRRRRDRP